MKKLKIFFILYILLFSLECMSQNLKTTQNIIKLDGTYKIKQQETYFEVDTTTVTVKHKDLKAINSEYKVIRKNKLGFVDIIKPSDIAIEDFVMLLSKDELVESIIYSSYGKYNGIIPDDTYLNFQWHLPVINAFEAWNITMGSPNVIVAILDSGTDWTHSDLGLGSDTYQNIYLNQGEDIWIDQNNPTTGNGIDDDNNGFIDDWKGWNFANNSNDSRGPFYHGTFVAGIVSAKANNNHGIAGVAGGRNEEGVKLLSYCVGLNAPVSSILDDAIIAAVDNGAKIIQLSLSVSQSSDIESAIQYAIDNNVVIICSSGNNFSSSVSFPASNINVISVGATNINNQRANFSNYGNNLDVVAPGDNIYSTTLNDSYTTDSGTSYAAPIVSGVAALILSVNPNLIGQQVRNIIESTAQKERTDLYTYSTTSGKPNGSWNYEMGYGLVDAYAAVQAAILVPPPSIIGDDEVCYDGSQFTLVPSSNNIFWTVDNPSLFDVNPTGNPTNVTRIASGTGSATLSARIGSANGTVIAQKTIDACPPAILSGANDIPCRGSEIYTLSGLPSGMFISWSSSTSSFVVNSLTGNSTTVTRTGAGSGTLNAKNFNGHTIISKSFPSCNAQSFMNTSVSTSQTVTNCGDITIQNVTVNNSATLNIITCGNIIINNVTVTSGAKLILDAGGEVIINEIDVQEGAEFEIKE